MKFEDYLKTYAPAQVRSGSGCAPARRADGAALRVAGGPRRTLRRDRRDQRRRLPIPAPRGVIFDREGKVLVDSRPIYNVILSREDAIKNKDLYTLIEPLSEGLGVEKDILRERSTW